MQIAEPFITRSQLEQKFAQVKNLKSMSTQSKPPLGNKPGTHRESSAELDRLKGEVATLKARLASAPAKPATLTAAAYLASVARPTMTRAQFSRLPRGEQGKAIKTITLVP